MDLYTFEEKESFIKQPKFVYLFLLNDKVINST
jgi:hypothetical protein